MLKYLNFMIHKEGDGEDNVTHKIKVGVVKVDNGFVGILM